MKNEIALLMKIQVMRVMNPAFFRDNSDKKRKRRICFTFAGAVLLALLMMFYSGMMAYGYVKIGEAAVISRMMLGTCSLLLIVLTFFKSGGALFGSRDFDMVMSLPIKAYQVVISKIGALYLVGLGAFVIFFLPAMAVYSVHTGLDAELVLSVVLMLLFGPVLPTACALALGTLILVITSRLRHTQLISLILYIVVFLAFMLWAGGLSGADETKLAQIGVLISDTMGRLYPPAAWAASCAEGRGIAGTLVFAVVSSAVLGVFVAVVSAFYIRINSAVASLKRRQTKRVRTGKARTSFYALYNKELRRLLSSSIYAMNTTVGVLLMLLAGFVVLAIDPADIEKAVGIPGIMQTANGVLPLLLALMVSISPTTAASLSLEGKSRWIMCSLPMEPMKIFEAKIALNLSITTPAILVSGLCFWVKFRPRGLQMVLLFLVPVCYSLFSSVFGMYMNVKFPSYDWTHEQQAVKNSTSGFISVMAGMILPLIPFIAAFRFPAWADLFSAAGAGAALGIAFYCFRRLKRTVLYV